VTEPRSNPRPKESPEAGRQVGEVRGRRQSRILIAAAVWTLYVWISRIVIMAGQDDSVGFKVVHGILAAVSIAFGLAVGKIGWDARRSLRAPRDPAPAHDAERVDQTAPV
jgi:hypothetical protein